MLLQQPRFGFTFSFQDPLMPHLVALLDSCSIGNVNLAAEWLATLQMISNKIYFLDGDSIDNVTLRL